MNEQPPDMLSLESIPAAARGGVLTIGNFDGVHVGHRAILSACRAAAEQSGGPVVAMTFEPPPDLVLRPDDVPLRLTPTGEKARLLREAGAKYAVAVEASRELLGMSPDEFVEGVVMQRFAPRRIVEGHDFCYGRKRAGDVDTLRRQGERLGFGVEVVDKMTVEMPEGPRRVSSTFIRGLLADGRVEDAARCLGRAYRLFGDVVSGHGRGGPLLEHPTANLDALQQIVPADGVYAGLVEVAGRRHGAAVSIGTKPTFGENPRCIEVNLIDYRPGEAGMPSDLYGRRLWVDLLARLRGQEAFDGVEQLKAQIAKDVQRAREIFQSRT